MIIQSDLDPFAVRYGLEQGRVVAFEQFFLDPTDLVSRVERDRFGFTQEVFSVPAAQFNRSSTGNIITFSSLTTAVLNSIEMDDIVVMATEDPDHGNVVGVVTNVSTTLAYQHLLCVQ